MFTGSVLVSLISFFVGLAEAILGLRVLFRLFNANATNPFVHWIYQTSAVLIDPFRNIFQSQAVLSPGFVLDISALFAMLMYAIIGYLLAALLGWVPAPTARRRWWGRYDDEAAPARRTRR